jgi:hypothetical protein
MAVRELSGKRPSYRWSHRRAENSDIACEPIGMGSVVRARSCDARLRPGSGVVAPVHDRGRGRPACRMRAVTADANNFLYLIKANQLACTDPQQIKAPTLILYSPMDLLFPQPWIERTAAAIREAGTPIDMAPLHGPNGHLNGVLHIAQASEHIAAFLTD